MVIVFKVSDNVKKEMIEHYSLSRRDKTPPYAIFQADEGGSVITLYESGKAVFSGISADIDAQLWKDLEMHLNKRDINKELKEKDAKDNDKTYYYYDAIGSDEVGTGDYLLPIVVTASFVKKNDIPLLEKLKINDSKKMSDEKILRCAPILINKIPHESIILTNKEYNEYNENGYNMNKVKAVLHNKVLYALTSKKYAYQKIIVDQFAYPKVYFSYLTNEENLVKNITFITKAESKNLSVAVASVISRYLFLKEKEKLDKKYNLDIPKGAGLEVDNFVGKFIKDYGKTELSNIAKISFGNTKKVEL